MILVFSVVMMMNVAVNGEEEGERNAEERTAVREDEKQEHEEDRFDLRRGRARPHRASTRPATVSCVCIRATAALLQPANARVYNAP